jgi:hypothetical protein
MLTEIIWVVINSISLDVLCRAILYIVVCISFSDIDKVALRGFVVAIRLAQTTVKPQAFTAKIAL